MSSSTSQPQAAPHAPHASSAAPPSPVPTPPPKSVARLSDATNAHSTAAANPNSPRAHASNSPAPDIPTTGPTPSIPNTRAPQATATETEEHVSFNDKLNAADRYWKFKAGLGAIAITTGLVGIGCFAWLMSTDLAADSDSYYTGYNSYAVWPGLITWSISIAFIALCTIIFLVRKRPVHPGVRVSMDLLLWLAFIITAMFAIFALRDVLDYGLYGGPGGYSYSSSDGDYVLASNGTWAWEQDTSYINSPRDCTRYTQFQNCEEQDAYVNKLWAEKGSRSNITLAGVVCQFFGLVIHFVLFVWACVDCHRHNRSKVSKDAEKIAASIVQTMIANGAIVPPPGQAHMTAPPGQFMYYQMPPNQQGYPMHPPYMQQGPGQMQHFVQHPQMAQQQQRMAPGQYPMGQPGMPPAASINEKTAARYA
ncbi:hypothetical protein G6011_03648 [Alternaria panax]|uniref:Uncharacterized protein n=1 Tax=Alternaria panax TaxID=48097 RepID=A0AAD4NT20_9PLEO|nr:hypothetical protein G6011_03648 [Alternaria panax]